MRASAKTQHSFTTSSQPMEDKDEKSHDPVTATEHAPHSPPPSTPPPPPPPVDKEFLDIPLSDDQSHPDPSQHQPPTETPAQQTPSIGETDTPTPGDEVLRDPKSTLHWWQKITFSYVTTLVQKAQKYALFFPDMLFFFSFLHALFLITFSFFLLLFIFFW